MRQEGVWCGLTERLQAQQPEAAEAAGQRRHLVDPEVRRWRQGRQRIVRRLAPAPADQAELCKVRAPPQLGGEHLGDDTGRQKGGWRLPGARDSMFCHLSDV